MSQLPANVSATVRRLNPHLYGVVPAPPSRLPTPAIPADLRQIGPEAKLNKTERAYLAYLRTLGDSWVGVQCITLVLGHDCRFTPDFWALSDGGLRAIDVKGKHVWEDSRIKIKWAARMYPWIHFVVATRDGAVWKHEAIRAA